MSKPFGYIIMKDTFMSGWGRAEGGKSYFALEVHTLEEAGIVSANAHARPEMEHIKFVAERPTAGMLDHLTVGTRESEEKTPIKV